MEPYYQDESVTIYHADCREVIPTITCDIVMTDPPYGVEKSSGTINRKRAKAEYTSDFEDSPRYIARVVIPVVVECLKRWPVVLTPGNKCLMQYPQPDSLGCFYQPAAVGLQVFGNLDSQPILYYGKNPTKKNMGVPCSYVLTETPEKNGHPCPKPLGIWKRLMTNVTLEGMTVFDPFMGSGTTVVAARETGRKAIGAEIDERYCEIAAKRCSQRLLFAERLGSHAACCCASRRST